MRFKSLIFNPLTLLVFLIMGVYWQFFLLGKIPIPADTLVGAYYPWLDYKWGYSVGVPVKNPPISDVFSQFFLWKYLSIDMMKQGIWPLWNPYSFSGTPFLATYHSATLLPFNILLFLPKYLGWGLFIFGQTLFAAVGMYFLLGKYTKSSVGKIAGSLVFCLSGLMTTWVEFGTAVWAASMLPWIFFAFEQFLMSKKVRYLLLMALFFATLYLSGHAQLTTYSTIIYGAYVLFKILNREMNRFDISRVTIFWILGVGLSLIQLLPTFDLTNLSIRGDEAYSEQFNYGLNPWYEIVRLFAADFFGNPTTYNAWDKLLYHEHSSFLGSLTLPLILPLVLKQFRRKLEGFWVLVFFLSIFFSFESPLTHWIYGLNIPLLTYSSATRLFFITSFSAGILVALALNKYLTIPDYKSWVRKSAVLFITSFLGIFLGFLIITLWVKQLPPYKDVLEIITDLQISIKNSIVPLGILVIFLLFSLIKRQSRFIIYLVVIIFFLDLGRYFVKYNPFTPQHLIFPKTPLIEFINSKSGLFRISRVDQEIMPPNTWINYKISSIEGYDPLALENYSRFFNRLNGNSYQAQVSRYVEAKNYPVDYISSLNVKYLLAVKRDQDGRIPGDFLNYKIRESVYKKVFEDKASVILENPYVKDRAYFIDEVIAAVDEQQFLNQINRATFNPTRQALVLDKDLKSGNYDASGQVEIKKYSPIEIELSTETKNDGFLILADTYEKNWRLLQNQQEVSLYEVNGAFKGIKVPTGKTDFKLYYFPKSFDLGLKLTLSSFLLLIIISIVSLKKKIW